MGAHNRVRQPGPARVELHRPRGARALIVLTHGAGGGVESVDLLAVRDAASAAIRLVDMGAPSYMVASSLHAVLAQRLLRLVCESCKEEHRPEPHAERWLEAHFGEQWAGHRFMRGRGCSHCNGTGYAGRTGVYEMLEMAPELVRAAGLADPNAFAEAARPQLEGRTLTDRALELVLAGRTTVSEAIRVATDVEG